MNANTQRPSFNLFMMLVTTAMLAGCGMFASADDQLTESEQLLASGQYSEALIALRNVLTEQPESARAQLALARVSVKLGNADAAEKALDDAVKFGADKATVDALRADLYLSMGGFEPLLKDIDSNVLTIAEPRRTQLRAQALAGLRRCPEASPLARQLLVSDPTQVTPRQALAECTAQRGNLPDALVLAEQAIAAQPDSAEAWMMRGRLEQLMGRGKEAEASWNKALQLAPGQLSVGQQMIILSTLADLQATRDDLVALQATHQSMVRIAPQSLVAEVLAARLALMKGDTATATPALQKIVGQAPNLAPAHAALMSSLLAQRSIEQALRQIGLLRQAAPEARNFIALETVIGNLAKAPADSEEYWLAMAAAQAGFNQPGLARMALEAALQKQPPSLNAQAALVQLHLRMGNPRAALAAADKLAMQAPDNLTALMLKAEAHNALEEFPQAAAAVQQVWAKAPSAAVAVALYQARVKAKSGDEVQPLQQWLASNPGDVNVRSLYADVLRVKGQNREAIAELEKAAAAAPKNPLVLNNLAWLYYIEKNPRALATAKRAHDLVPRQPSIADTYGWILVESGRASDGLKVLQAALDDGGAGLMDLRFHHAAALARAGQTAPAKAELQALMAEKTEFASRAEAQKLMAQLP